MQETLHKIKEELRTELTGNILPFWMEAMTDSVHGGFFGRRTGTGSLDPDAPKGAILNARILWTFSSAALHLKEERYRVFAEWTKDYIFKHFFDEEFGGTYWLLHSDGSLADTKKQIYSQAFFIYALVEYYRLTDDPECLNKAKELFLQIEMHSFDSAQNGYLEAFDRKWSLLKDLRLSDKDANEKKTMNTHLHILEAYTNLYRVWKDDGLKTQLKNLIELFLKRIVNPVTHHLNLFFDEDWTCKSTLVSYGHDIEASWLLDEAAVVLGDSELLVSVRAESMRIAEAALEGLQQDGSLINERNTATGHTDWNRDWWPQAEAVVGFWNAWTISGDAAWSDRSLKSWTFIQQNLLDPENGEWFWAVSEKGEPDRDHDKAGFWKCPYHNSRMCLEMLKRL